MTIPSRHPRAQLLLAAAALAAAGLPSGISAFPAPPPKPAPPLAPSSKGRDRRAARRDKDGA
jgi:hypothetical protein